MQGERGIFGLCNSALCPGKPAWPGEGGKAPEEGWLQPCAPRSALPPCLPGPSGSRLLVPLSIDPGRGSAGDWELVSVPWAESGPAMSGVTKAAGAAALAVAGGRLFPIVAGKV